MVCDSTSDIRLGVIGCGTMGKVIISTLLQFDSLKPHQIQGSVSQPESLERLTKQLPNLKFTTENESIIDWANVILICLKPQVAPGFLNMPSIASKLAGKVVISIAAGIKLSKYEEWLPHSQVIRAMPNTPCQIREGMIVLSAASTVNPTTRQLATSLFQPLGRCRFLDEKHMDAVTALSASGPAFGCIILEALADGGVMMGLPRDVAVELAAQSLQGAARMVLQTGSHSAQIKDAVTTPAGCTIAGILTMEDGKIRSVLARAIQETAKVASTLGNQK